MEKVGRLVASSIMRRQSRAVKRETALLICPVAHVCAAASLYGAQSAWSGDEHMCPVRTSGAVCRRVPLPAAIARVSSREHRWPVALPPGLPDHVPADSPILFHRGGLWPGHESRHRIDPPVA